jgi:hypothetical protein
MWSRTRPKLRRAAARRDWYACRSTQHAGGTCSTKYLKRDTVNAGLDRLFTTVFADEQFIGAQVQQGMTLIARTTWTGSRPPRRISRSSTISVLDCSTLTWRERGRRQSLMLVVRKSMRNERKSSVS